MKRRTDLKNKWNEKIEIFSALTRAKLEGGIFSAHRRARNRRLAAALIAGIVFLGVLAVTKIHEQEGLGSYLSRHFSRKGLLAMFKGGSSRDAGVPTKVLSDFESIESLAVWELASAHLELSSEYPYGGAQSGRVTLHKVSGAGMSSSIGIEDAFTNRGSNQMGDWSAFEWLRFHVFNPNETDERLILQIKDQWKRIFKLEIFLPAHDGQVVLISLPELSKSINLRKIEQLQLFRWEPKDDKEFFIDDFRLLQKGMGQAVFRNPAKAKSRPVNPVDFGFELKKHAWRLQRQSETDPPIGEIVRIPFVVTNETYAPCLNCTVEGGIPFPMGELKSLENLRLLSGQGVELSVQPRVLGRWADGSIKWVAPAFETSLDSGQSAGFYLDYGPEVEAAPKTTSLKAYVSEGSVQVNTGTLKAVFSQQNFYLFDHVFLDENGNGNFEAAEEVVSQAPLTLQFQGRDYRADRRDSDYKIEIEESGPVKAVVKASGWFQDDKGNRFCQVILRYTFFQGKSQVKLEHTLIYTGYPENRVFEPYQNLKLPANEMISAFGMTLPFKFQNPSQVKVQIGKGIPSILEFPLNESLRVMQQGWDLARIQTPASDFPPTDFFSGWMDSSDGARGVLVAIRNFRENFPKALSIDAKGALQIDLWPKEAGPLDLSTTKEALGPDDVGRGNAFGLGKTHELLIYFHNGNSVDAKAPQQAESFTKRLLIRNNPYWVEATGALGRLYPVTDRYRSEEAVLSGLFDWADRQPKNYAWYGMLNFGDTLTWYRSEDETKWYPEEGWHPEGRWGWYNCEGVGTHTGALLQFVRSGEWKYFEFGENLARHIMDVDTVHYNTIARDPRLKKILNARMSAVGGMHRHSANHWSGRTDESSHTSVVGLIYYYYLTGDERALDVIKEVGEYFLSEPFAYANNLEIVPHRAMANALWGDVLLFEMTGDARFKKAADKIIEIYLAGQQADGSFLENYNPKTQSWSGEKHLLYMEGYALGAFIAYHELTQDADVAAMLIKMLRVLALNEYSPAVTLQGFAYAYWITGDEAFLAVAERALKFILSNQQRSSDPLLNGLIYKKIIYHRPMAFLASVPYVFSALEDGFQKHGE